MPDTMMLATTMNERMLLKAALEHLIVGVDEAIGKYATAASPLAVSGWYTKKIAEQLIDKIVLLDVPK